MFRYREIRVNIRVLLLSFICLVFANIFAQFDPKTYNLKAQDYSTSPFLNDISLYQRYLSNSSCQFYPSCSRYCYLCIEKKGILKGIPLCWERLFRCNKDANKFYRYYKGYLINLPEGFNPNEIIGKPDNSKPSYKFKSQKYCEWLIVENEWDAAYSCFLNREYNNPSEENKFILGIIAMNNSEYSKAINWLEKSTLSEAKILVALCYYKMDRISKSFSFINTDMTIESEYFYRLRNALIVLYLIENYMYADSVLLKKALQDIGLPDLHKDIEGLDKKPSRGLFVVSSALVPGSGQLLNGFTKDGISSLLYTCLAGLYFGQEIKEKNIFGILFSGFIFISAYSGNLIGSYKAPERRLIEKKERLKSKIIQKVDLDNTIIINEAIKTIQRKGRE